MTKAGVQRWIAPAVVLLTAGAAVAATYSTNHQRSQAQPVAAAADASASALAFWAADLDSLVVDLRTVRGRLATDSIAGANISYTSARRHYKRAEALVEYYAAATAATMNGRRREFDDEDLAVTTSLEPSSVDRIESAILATSRPSTAAVAGVDTLIASVDVLRSSVSTMRPSRAQLLDASRLEIARIEALTITGFDTPATHAAMLESAEALRGVRMLVDGALAGGAASDQATAAAVVRFGRTVDRAIEYLDEHPDFDSFDRLTFIADYAEPIAKALGDIRSTAKIAPLIASRAWTLHSNSVLDSGAIDRRAYAPADAPLPTPELEQLGLMLFSDPQLSGPGTRACATCHRPDRAFTDGLAHSAALLPGQPSGRNTPSLLNAGFQPRQFLDNRAVSLEDQVAVVLASPTEMASSAVKAAERVGAVAEYQRRFAAVFGGARTGASSQPVVTARRVQIALASYVRSLTANHSRVDRALAGDRDALTPAERRGFNLFMGKAACGTCHFLPLFNGTAPPAYANTDPETIGVPASARGVAVDGDKGAGAISGKPLELHAFKVPTIRNVALTAPYMHNGVFGTLEDVVAFYDQGGAVGRGARLPNQTLSAAPLHLTTEERADLVALMRALTDERLERR